MKKTLTVLTSLAAFLALLTMVAGIHDKAFAGNPGEFVADAHTVALWRMNEGTGQTVADDSGNGRDLTLGSSTAVHITDPSWVATGRFSAALYFDESQQQYLYGTGSNTFPSNQVTVEMWVKTQDVNHAQIFTAGFINCTMIIEYGGSVGSEIGDGSNWSFCTSSRNVANNAWHYVAATYNGSFMKVYVDGRLVKSCAATTTLANPSQYWVGGRPSNTFLTGFIDEVRLSDVARTETEIRDYFKEAAGLKLIPSNIIPLIIQ